MLVVIRSSTETVEPRSWMGTVALMMAAAVGLTVLFWWPLWWGGGLVGGDVYPYSLPQKAFLSDSLHTGVIPLWNPLTGHGYPVLGESQTGALYPPHVAVYAVCDVGLGWNVILLGHYIAAFLAMAWFARALGLSLGGAVLAAVIYVYGWFPVRAFLDWAILGGVYLPLTLGAVERFSQSGRRRFLAGLSLSVGLQLLGGHYQIAFLTWLTGGAYVLWRLRPDWTAPWRKRPATPSGSNSGRSRTRDMIAITTAFALGVALATVQLLPSWELKGRSQRATVGGAHEPAYGHLPPGYFTQIVAPWFWYDATLDLDQALARLPLGQVSAGTNKIEAHCYFGQAPLLLLILSAVLGSRRSRSTKSPGSSERRDSRRMQLDPPVKTDFAELPGSGLSAWFWVPVAVVSLAYATGFGMPWLQSVPGFNFFRGPGRATIITTLAVAVLAGRGLDQLIASFRSARWQFAVTLLSIAATVLDLWWTPSAVQHSYAVAVGQPPIRFRDDSPLRKLLLAEPYPVRLYAPGPNLPNLLGVSSTPVYLGLGPREYFTEEFAIPETDPPDFHAYTEERGVWLRNAGVTHILSMAPLERRGWPVTLIWSGFDPMLNRAWARFDEPLWLYQLRESPGRVRLEDGATGATSISHYSAHRVVIRAETNSAGTLVLTDLADPGWTVTLDGQAAPVVPAGMYRGVSISPGQHEVIWSYRPRSVYWGAWVSGGAVLLLIAFLIGPLTSALPTKRMDAGVTGL